MFDTQKDYFLKLIASPITGKLQRFKGLCRGSECYIIGDGISIKQMDFRFLPKLDSIACNYSIFHNDIELLKPRYIVNYAPFFFFPELGRYRSEVKKSLRVMSELYRKQIDRLNDTDFFFNISNLPFVNGSNIYFLYKDFPGIDKDKHLEITNVFRASIMLAYYLGFKRAYLLGCDYTHLPSRSLHWYEKGEGVFVDQSGYEKRFLEHMSRFIDLVTVTVNGVGQNVRHITYSELSGKTPLVRENTELADEKYLDALSIYDGYSIY